MQYLDDVVLVLYSRAAVSRQPPSQAKTMFHLKQYDYYSSDSRSVYMTTKWYVKTSAVPFSRPY